MLGWEVIPRIGFGSFSVSPHGVGIMAGYFVGVLLMVRRARQRGFDEDHVWNAAAWGVVGAILGARIAYLTGHFDEFSSPLEWLQIWEGGISLVGGLLGGFTAAYIYVRRRGVDFFELTDLAAPGLALGTVIGRIGDLMIGDHLGKPASGWWGWKYRGGELISMPPCTNQAGDAVYPTASGCIEPGTVLHQTALYDQLWSVVILGVLLLLDRNPRRRGFLSLAWVSLYGLGRIATDFLRVDKTWLGLGLTGSQITSILFLAVAVYLLLRYQGIPGEPRPAKVPETVTAQAAALPATPAAASAWEAGHQPELPQPKADDQMELPESQADHQPDVPDEPDMDARE